MRTRRMIRAVAAACGIALTVGLTGAVPVQTAHAADEDLDCAESLIQKDLENGASWRMCARIHPVKGLVLEKIEFAPASGSREYSGYKRIIDSLYLSQLNVPYDTGHVQFNDITTYGFGSVYLMPQVPELCLGDTVDVHQTSWADDRLIERTIAGICTDEVATGLTTHSQEAQNATATRFIEHGTALEVSSVSKISWYEYQQKVTFDDHGGIDVGLAATGDLAGGEAGSDFFSDNPATGWPIGPSGEGPDSYATSHWHNAIYRVDFGIDSGESQRVEQWDYTSPGENQAPIIEGTRTQKDAAFHAIAGDGNDELSWWRVSNPGSLNKDGHARSYEIINRNTSDKYIPVTQPLVSFTNASECQEYASDNLNPGCPGEDILDYVAGDDAPLADPVAWVNVGFHHIDRDEDQSPMPVHWQRFQLVPRDFFAQSPSVTEARGCINGPSSFEIDSVNRPCIAKNAFRPKITAGSTPVKQGTVLTGSKGAWIENRTTWNYAFMWFRDGQPIIGVDDEGDPAPAINSTYTVTEEDLGASITVKVTASQVGFGSGTAESTAMAIPGGPTPTPTVPTPTVTEPSPSPSPTVTVAPPPALRSSTTTGKLTRSKVTVKQNARVKVSVKAAGASPSGRFEIRHGSKVIKVGYLRNGKATITLPKLKKARTYRLRVVYAGSPSVKTSSSKLITLRVTKR